MPYVAVSNFVAGQTATANDLNDLKANAEFIRTPVSYHYERSDNLVAAYSTVSDTFVEVDATNTTKTLNFGGGKVLIIVQMFADDFAMDLDINGARQGGASDGLWAWELAQQRPFSLYWLVDAGLTGNIPIKLVWKRFGGAGTARINTSMDFTFDIIEL